jgi:hypothetical protein
MRIPSVQMPIEEERAGNRRRVMELERRRPIDDPCERMDGTPGFRVECRSSGGVAPPVHGQA